MTLTGCLFVRGVFPLHSRDLTRLRPVTWPAPPGPCLLPPPLPGRPHPRDRSVLTPAGCVPERGLPGSPLVLHKQRLLCALLRPQEPGGPPAPQAARVPPGVRAPEAEKEHLLVQRARRPPTVLTPGVAAAEVRALPCQVRTARGLQKPLWAGTAPVLLPGDVAGRRAAVRL